MIGEKMPGGIFPGGKMNLRDFFGENLNWQNFELAGKLRNTIKSSFLYFIPPLNPLTL